MVLILSCAYFYFGSISDALSFARGKRFYIANPVVYLGRVKPDRAQDVNFRLVNFSNRQFRIVGCETSCGCTTLEDLPLSVPTFGERILKLKFVPKSGSASTVQIRLFTDNSDVPELSLKIDAQVASDSP